LILLISAFRTAKVVPYYLRHPVAALPAPGRVGMSIRRTQTRSTVTGETYTTHRRVRSMRSGGKVRQVTVLNLGRHLAVAQAH